MALRTLDRDEAAARYGDMAAMMIFRGPGGPWTLARVGGRGKDVVCAYITGGELVVLASPKKEGR